MTLQALRDGGKRALAAALVDLERDSDSDAALALLGEAWRSPKALVLGVTGPPGVGKSSLCAALLAAWRRDGLRVAVIAADPSSKASGGALLGDRVRIVHGATDGGVFVRSMAARDRLGGLADQILPAMVLMRALFDRVLIETVGVGQSETDVAGFADTVMFCVPPGAGDSLQFMKAGIVEIPHLVVVTKADLGAAAEQARCRWRRPAMTGRPACWPCPRAAARVWRPWKRPRRRIGRIWRRTGRLAVARHRQAEGWIAEALRDRFGRQGLARLAGLGFDLSVAAGAQPFGRLRELAAALEGRR